MINLSIQRGILSPEDAIPEADMRVFPGAHTALSGALQTNRSSIFIKAIESNYESDNSFDKISDSAVPYPLLVQDSPAGLASHNSIGRSESNDTNSTSSTEQSASLAGHSDLVLSSNTSGANEPSGQLQHSNTTTSFSNDHLVDILVKLLQEGSISPSNHLFSDPKFSPIYNFESIDKLDNLLNLAHEKLIGVSNEEFESRFKSIRGIVLEAKLSSPRFEDVDNAYINMDTDDNGEAMVANSAIMIPGESQPSGNETNLNPSPTDTSIIFHGEKDPLIPTNKPRSSIVLLSDYSISTESYTNPNFKY
jgi:hypothetical protein